MNWGAIAAISQTVGSLAVVVSLIYVAVQIRQNTALAQTQYHGNAINAVARFQDWKAANPENARIFRQGMMDFRSITLDERIMLDGVLTDLVLMFKDILEAHGRGFADIATYEAWKGFIGANLGMPGGQMWWAQGRNIFVGAVQTAVDLAIKQTSPYDELMSVVFRE